MTQDHNGKWTCAGRLIGRDEESDDEFDVLVIANELSVASIIGMVFGAIFVFASIVYIGFLSFRKRQRLRAEARNDNIVPDNTNHEF